MTSLCHCTLLLLPAASTALLLLLLQLATDSHVGTLQCLGQQRAQTGEAHEHQGNADEGIENGGQLASGCAWRQAAMACNLRMVDDDLEDDDRVQRY